MKIFLSDLMLRNSELRTFMNLQYNMVDTVHSQQYSSQISCLQPLREAIAEILRNRIITFIMYSTYFSIASLVKGQ